MAESAAPPCASELLLPPPQGKGEHSSRGGGWGEEGAKYFAKDLSAEGEFLAASLEIQTPDVCGRSGSSQDSLPALHSGLQVPKALQQEVWKAEAQRGAEVVPRL